MCCIAFKLASRYIPCLFIFIKNQNTELYCCWLAHIDYSSCWTKSQLPNTQLKFCFNAATIHTSILTFMSFRYSFFAKKYSNHMSHMSCYLYLNFWDYYYLVIIYTIYNWTIIVHYGELGCKVFHASPSLEYSLLLLYY